ncbi:MAG: histidinol-phosphate transaminase [Acidimicrobiia bacterium]
MPTFREDIAALTAYEVGRPIAEVAREHGIDPSRVVKLTSNESPEGPFPGAVEAAAQAMTRSNRYPDPDVWELAHRLADELAVDYVNLLFGAGSVALLSEIANAVGGPGTTSVYAWPGFVMYRFVSKWAMTRPVEVPLDEDFELDLERMAATVDETTRVVYLCNPNNPTGTIRGADEIERFVDGLPESVLVAIDEAYHHFVTDERYRTAIPLALERPNVVVLRTFSKIYSLAAQRIGYAVGQHATLREIRKAQAPLTVNQVAQAAALASLGQPEEIRRRRDANGAARRFIEASLSERGLEHPRSHTNFVYFKMSRTDSRSMAGEFVHRGVIIRPMSSGWMRVTVGSEEENKRFVEALDEVLAVTVG